MNLPEAKTFVRAWWESSTMEELCERLPGLDRRGASNIAANLRRCGVDLKSMPRGSNRCEEKLTADDCRVLRDLAESLKTECEQAAQKETDVQAADRQRQKVTAASAWSSVSGDDE